MRLKFAAITILYPISSILFTTEFLELITLDSVNMGVLHRSHSSITTARLLLKYWSLWIVSIQIKALTCIFQIT